MMSKASLVMCLAFTVTVTVTAGAEDRPLRGASLVLSASRSYPVLRFVGSDASFQLPAPGASSDPVTSGLTVQLFSGSEVGAPIGTPAGLGTPGWRASGHTYRFTNRAAPAPPSALRTVALTAGRGIRLLARAAGLPLTGPKGAIAIRVMAGSLRWCAVFGPATVRSDANGHFRASDGGAPSITDCDDDTLMAATSLCGDGVVQDAEGCDGTAGACLADGYQCRPPGVAGQCGCCGYGNDFGHGFKGCCDGSFACPTTGQCLPSGDCCTGIGGVAVWTLSGTFPLNACCPGLALGLEKVGAGLPPLGLGCCVPDAGACTADTDCCSRHCDAGACSSCRSTAEPCARPAECCSGSCNVAGTCDACAATGWPCVTSSACCSGVCNATTFACDP